DVERELYFSSSDLFPTDSPAEPLIPEATPNAANFTAWRLDITFIAIPSLVFLEFRAKRI
ncbi:MAG: hypothetical protein ACP5I1_01800, partial [Candidatus Hinthialibacter sp.]